MKYKLLRFSVVSIFLMLCGLVRAGDFTNFAITLTAEQFTTEELTAQKSFGIQVNADGTYTVVDAGSSDANVSLSAVRFNDGQHGWVNCTFTIPVNGPVKVGLGNCQYGAQTGTITDSEGTQTSLTVGNANCWTANNVENTTSYTIYRGTSPTTLTITQSGYCPYISVEAVNLEDLVEEATVTFALGTEGSGVTPAAKTAEVGSTITIPQNTSLYSEGKTLTAWTDGQTTYAIGSDLTVSADMTLTPVFTENSVTFEERTTEVTATWDFQQKNGAVVQSLQGNKGTGLVVTQISVNGESIDFPLYIDASNGKYANANWQDWAQVNDGTVFTLPMYKGTVVSTFSMNDNSQTTFAGGTGTFASNVNTYTYEGSASTMDIVTSGGTYYRWVKAVYAVPTGDVVEPVEIAVSYSLDGIDCQGSLLPEGGTYTAGDKYILPAKNFTLYKEGFTLTAWTDGTSIFPAGSTITLPESDVTLFPVFTENSVNLGDRTAPVTVKFDFQRKNGAPTVSFQNKTGLVWVAQATVGDAVIDVPAFFSTNPGKFANGSWSDWAQLNSGTTWTIPSCKGAVVSIEAFNALGTGNTPTTIDGQSDYTSDKTISYTVASPSETVDVVIGSDGTYYRYIQVVLPVVEQSQSGESFDNVAGSISWAVGNEITPEVSSDIASALSSTTVSVGDNLTYETISYSTINTGTMVKYRPGTSNAGNVDGVMIEYRVKTAAGVKFTPQTVAFDAVKVGTDGAATSWGYTADGKASTVTDIAASTILRNNGANSSTAQLRHSVDVSAAGECETFTFRYYISKTANNKDQCLGNVVITGTVSGQTQAVTTYTLTAEAVPAEGGQVSIYPAATDNTYTEGDELTLTATESFGYDFESWTDAEGNVISTEPKFKYTVAQDAALKANFKAVETFELALTVDGTNSYMVSISPEPTVIDGKSMYEAGTAVQLEAHEYDGLVSFSNWSDGETGSSKLIAMDSNVTLTAYYAESDIIAGWDFYVAGKDGRIADFASENNEAAALSLVNTETGATSGWLDKSTLAGGGYEGFSGAAVNWTIGANEGDVGHYHWQTKLNAEGFSSINVQFQMLYNYNAYKTYNVEYSLDGTTWTGVGSIIMSGTKSPASFSQPLPSEAENQAELYIRMIADKNSDIDGTSSKNDGNTLAMFFITGVPQLIDDGTAPVLVASVPAAGATGASATGKIVLTFDERISLAEGATATLAGKQLSPTANGKTVSFEYKGLEYATEYTFTLPAGTVSDLTGNILEDDITLSFTTMVRPSVDKQLYDAVVETTDQLASAIDAANKRADQNTRYRIFLKNGTYTLPLSATATISSDDGNTYASPITHITGSNISFVGESRDGVVVSNLPDGSPTYAGTYGTTSVYDGIGKSDVLQISGSVRGTYFQDLTVRSGIEDARGRNIAVQDCGSHTIYKNTVLYGYQDTWTSNNDNGLYYFDGGKVRGRTDFLCGKGDAFFNAVQIQVCMNTGGYIAVPSKSIKYGYVFSGCTIKGESSQLNGKYTLGRPWGQGTPVALWIDTRMEVVPSAIGWSEMSNGWPKRFAEYNSMNANGASVDLSGRKTTFGDGHENNPVLTAAEALEASNPVNMFGEWNPMLLAEQAPLPQNVTLCGQQLSWDDSSYALLWAIVQDGVVIDFTTEPTYIVTDTEATYAVRAANEMGGLSEAVEATVVESVATGLTSVERTTQSAHDTYNVQGQRVGNDYKGIVVSNGKKSVRK